MPLNLSPSKLVIPTSLLVALLLGPQTSAFAAHTHSGPQTLVIGVDHADPPNQREDQHRVFSYTDFFAREVTVHTGDTLDFRTAPNMAHLVALARDERAARAAYPLFAPDTGDALAPGSGQAKLELGPANGSIVGGSLQGGGTIGDPNAFPPTACGLPQFGQAACTFQGGDDVESQGLVPGIGQNGTDWLVRIDAAPGEYDYFCLIHPGMRGKLRVADADDRASTQAEIDARGQTQFQHDQAEALQAEREASSPRFRGDEPGRRVYQVSVGLSAADNRVALDEMLPQHLDLVPGDRVEYVWRDPSEGHTVTFPTNDPGLPAPFGLDCGSSFASGGFCLEPGASQPEPIADPGTSPSGTALVNPAQLVDSGLLIGAGYGLGRGTPRWSVVTNASTAAGSYAYQCTLHDWMHGTLEVRR